MKRLPPMALLALAEVNIRLFEVRIASKRPIVNVQECTRYLELWRDVSRHCGDWDGLASDERREIYEAVTCGDFDALLLANGYDPYGPGDDFHPSTNPAEIEF